VIVMKFGGSSVAGAEHLGRVADRVLQKRALHPCVVVSAMGKTTDALFAAAGAARKGDIDAALATIAPALGHAEAVAGELLGADDADALAAIAVVRDELHVLLRGVAMLRELTPRTNDTIVAYGERLSSLLLAALLAHRGARVLHVDARRFLRTDDRFGHARPQRDVIADLCGEHVMPHLQAGTIVVTEGYVGATAEGYTTTLGRGGSDWSAALLGEALRADEVQIWTDVEGVLTADPRLVPEARPIDLLTPAEAAELAAFGAKVLHPSTMQPAVDAGVPITVRNTQRPEGAFTTIDPRSTVAARNGIAALATRGPVTVLTMTSTRMLATSGYLAKLFAAFGALDICIDLVVTAEISVACTVEPDAPIDRLIEALAGLARVEIAHDRAIVAAVGEGLRSAPGTVERACRALLPVTPELICFGGNDRNLSFVVPRDAAAAAMQRLHGEFFAIAPAPLAALPRGKRSPVRTAPSADRSFEASP
jgi:aspartate kinase